MAQPLFVPISPSYKRQPGGPAINNPAREVVQGRPISGTKNEAERTDWNTKRRALSVVTVQVALTSGGKAGSMTFTDGILTAYTAPT